MKILIMSDLHLDVNRQLFGRSIFPALLNHIRNHRPDLLIIAGDLTGSAVNTVHYLQQIQERTHVTVKFVPGNHDIWTEKPDADASWQGYHALKDDESSLLEKPYLVGDDYVIIGGMGWYDYSFISEMGMDEEDIVSLKRLNWKDADYAKWGLSDKSLCQQEINSLHTQLERYQDKKVIMVTHTVPYKDFTIYKPQNPTWNMCNAFMGSQQIGNLFDNYTNIKYVVFGHTHFRFGEVPFGDKTIICKPLGYLNEWVTRNIEAELEAASTILYV